MKITCQSCQSKYNVADEKVQGKIVKIRCRKCGATIVVNGTGGASTNGTPAPDTTAQTGAVGGADAQWHVNVGDNDQRTLTLAELVDAYNTGVVTQETFIWCDGMDDWRPLAEVESVVAALHASAGQMAAGTAGAFEPHGSPSYDAPAAHVPSYEPPAAAAPAYEAPVAYAAPAAEAKRAAVVKRSEARGRDLFSTNAGEDIQTSAPAVTHGMAATGDAGLTGQRNENSVLFSLAVLTKNSEDRAPVEQTTANREDSGLIDLKALAAKAESMRPGAPEHDVFSAPLGMTQPPLGAPVGALGASGDAQPKSKLPLYIGGGAGVALLLVLGIVIGVKIAGPGPMPLPTASAYVPLPSATAEPSATASATAEASASAAPSASVAATTAKKPLGGGAWHPPSGSGGVKPPSGSGGSGGTTPPTPTPKKGGGDCGCNGDLMCLMKCSTH
ncbi:MAG TPA: zinc-ribbon domain-containing protein [Polyangiaceae bacterium]|jgi:predicted Zn finger-like uncharacterized protein